ncbi:MAG: PspC domain-containing protein [Bacteroidaceae bacterium]|nr:PspC domain-containing protein [Bacteroidaceae bacterium]
MKRTINVNLGGRPFQITEDAYTRLDDYLKSIAACLKHNEYGEEIVSDIEARIGELCDERLQQSRAGFIDVELVNEMINRMGNPEAMMEEEEQPQTAEANEKPKNSDDNKEKEYKEFFKNIKLEKKFYLNKEERMIGGVVSGIAAYLNVDVTILRIIMVLLIAAIGLIALLAYLIVWAITPTAETTTDKLRMQGIEPTPENIADRLTNEESKAKCSDNKAEVAKKERLKTILLAVAIVVAALFFHPTITIIGNNPFLYITGFCATLTFALLVIYVALGLTNLLSEKYKKIVFISFITSLVVTIVFIVLSYLSTNINI